MKVTNVVVSTLFLILQLSVYSIHGSVVQFHIQRRGDWKPELFTVYFAGGSKCTNAPHQWCTSLRASFNYASGNRKTCSCTCLSSFPTFLPPNQKCVDHNDADSFGECADYFQWQGDNNLLYRPIDLAMENPMDFFPNAGYSNCYVVSGHFFDYSGFQSKWQSICDEIFSFNSSSGTVKFQWKVDKVGKLSGRIIRLNVTCHSSSSNTPDTRCMLFKALGTVTYESSINVVVQTTCPASPSPSSPTPTSSPSLVSPLPLPPPSSTSLPPPASSSPSPGLVSPSLPPPPPSSSSPRPFSTPLPSQRQSSSTLLPSSPLSSLSSPSESVPTGVPSTHSPTRLLSSTLLVVTSTPIASTAETKLQSPLPFHSEEASSQETSTGIPKNIISTGGPHTIIAPSKSSIATKSTSSSATIDGPGNNEARADGAASGAVIGAAVGGAAVFGIVVVTVIVFCKRRKLWKDKEKDQAKLEVKNPVYGRSDIPLNTTTGNQVTSSSEQDSQPTYQGLIINSGQKNGSALYSSPNDNNYDNCTVYQSLDKKKHGLPVYQSLQKGQVATGHPNPSATSRPSPSVTGTPSGRPNVTAEPVYNILEQPDTQQGTMTEDIYDNDGQTHDPLYNVLEGPDTEQTYAASDVGDPLYNVLEGPESRPESRQGPEEPLYNVLESSEAESNPSGTQGSHNGASSEPLYNVLEGPESHGPNKGGVGYAAANGPTAAGAHDNPVYEQSIELNAPYAAVHKPGSKKESVYEPLSGPQRQDLYMSISKGGKVGTSSHA